MKSSHNAGTFNPYDPGETIGDIGPAPNPQSAKKNKCGAFGQILVAVVAVAIAVALPEIAPGVFGASGLLGAGGQIAAAVIGNVASQGVGLATGVQDKFDWKGVAMAGVSAGVGAGLGAALGKAGVLGSKVLTDLARGALGSAITQGVGVATGLQARFDWAGVAASGIGAVAGGIAGRTLPGKALPTHLPTFGNLAGTSGADLLASAASRSLFEGSDFGDNVLRQLPSAIANTIGGAIAGEMQRADARHAAAEAARAEANLRSNYPQIADAFDRAVWGSDEPSSLPGLDGISDDVAASSAEWNGTMARMNGRLARALNPALQAMADDIKRANSRTGEESAAQALAANSSAAPRPLHFTNRDNSGRDVDTVGVVGGDHWDGPMEHFGNNYEVEPGRTVWRDNAVVMARVNAALDRFDSEIGELLIFGPKTAVSMIGEAPNLVINGIDYATGRVTFNEAALNSIPLAGVFAAERGLARVGREGIDAERTAVIGRMDDLTAPGVLRPGEYTIADRLPDLGSPRANYYNNMSVLRAEMRRGVPIRDASAAKPDFFPVPTALNPGRTVRQTFTGAERNQLRNRGWTFDGQYWNPPK
jgi:hypothetical protein